MNRRTFIKRASGLIIPATFGIFVSRRAKGQAFTYRDQAWLARVNRATGGGGGACTTQQLTQGGSFDNTNDWTFYTRIAGSFSVGGSGFTCCAVDAEIWLNGTTSGTLTPSIYTNLAGSPGVLVSAGTAVSRNSIQTTATAYQNFVGLSAALSASTTYWLILQASSAETSPNFIRWISQTTGAVNIKGSTDGIVWDALRNNESAGLKLYST